MKKTLLTFQTVCVLVIVLLLSCEKGDSESNPPLANAGEDTIIALPVNLVDLDGSDSTDPSNNIVSYQWTKTQGPSSFNIASANSAHTQVTDLVEGVYSFQLMVTNGEGLSSSDTVKITVEAEQAPQIEWQKSYGGSGIDLANSIRATSDGGYIMAGWSSSNDIDVMGSHGMLDFWVVKMNSSGDLQWQKAMGGSGSEQAFQILPTTDGGYITAGYTLSNNGDVTGNHGSYDFWVVKFTGSGSIQWTKALGGTGEDCAFSIQITPAGNYVVTGYAMSNDGDVSSNHGNKDIWVVKLSPEGALLWQNTFGGSGDDVANFVQITPDNGCAIAGYTTSNDGDVTNNNGGKDIWLIKLNNKGELEWQKNLGGPADDEANALQITPDAGYIIAGGAKSNGGDILGHHGSGDYWVVKLDSSGNVQWQKSLGGTGDDLARSIAITSDLGYVITGYTESNDGDVTFNHGKRDNWVVKLNESGDIIWQKAFGGTLDDGGHTILATALGEFIISGGSFSSNGDVSVNRGAVDFWVVKLKQ